MLSVFGFFLSGCNKNKSNLNFLNSISQWDAVLQKDSRQNKTTTIYLGSSACPFCREYKDMPVDTWPKLDQYLREGDLRSAQNYTNQYENDGPLNAFASNHTIYAYYVANLKLEEPYDYGAFNVLRLQARQVASTKGVSFNGNVAKFGGLARLGSPWTITFDVDGSIKKFTCGTLNSDQINSYWKL